VGALIELRLFEVSKSEKASSMMDFLEGIVLEELTLGSIAEVELSNA